MSYGGGMKRQQKSPNFIQNTDFMQTKFNPQGKKILNPQNFKIVKCKNFETGMCKYGDNCTFAHGDEEIRSKTENSFQTNQSNPNFNQNMNNYGGFPQQMFPNNNNMNMYNFPPQMNYYPPQMEFNNYQMMNGQENEFDQSNLMYNNFSQNRNLMNENMNFHAGINPNVSNNMSNTNLNPLMNPNVNNNIGNNLTQSGKFQYPQDKQY